ncbi:MAG TPA: hypothetical protein DCP32_06855 [Anaerolineaceae bacterium]|nr:hypothetical protein [Anaerolineaceae bacterium]
MDDVVLEPVLNLHIGFGKSLHGQDFALEGFFIKVNRLTAVAGETKVWIQAFHEVFSWKGYYIETVQACKEYKYTPNARQLQ